MSQEPFSQQPCTNLVRWIIELDRRLPRGQVTLCDACRTINTDLNSRGPIASGEGLSAHTFISGKNYIKQKESLEGCTRKPVLDQGPATCWPDTGFSRL